MSKQTQTTESDHNKKQKPQVEPMVNQPGGEVALPGLLPLGPQAAAGGGSIDGQASLLGGKRWQSAQRQMMATHIGRKQGNAHLQRVVASLPVAQREISKASGEISIGAPGNVYTDDEQWEDSLNFLLLQTTLMPLDRAIQGAEAKPPRFDQVRSESQDALVGLTSYREIAGEDADTSAAEDALFAATEIVNGFTDDNAGRTLVFETLGLVEGLKMKEEPDKADPGYMKRMAAADLNKVLNHLYLPLVSADLGKLDPSLAATYAMSAGIRVGMLQVADESQGQLATITANMKIIEGTARAWASKGANLGKVLKEARQTVMSTAMAKPKPKPSSHSVTGFVQPSLQRTGDVLPAPDEDIGRRIQTAAGSGSRLDDGVQRRLEDGLGADMSKVRIHTGREADSLARSVNAVAFTTGQDIFFREGTYNPHSTDGLRLLAHEAAHTVQQAAGPVDGTPTDGGVSISTPGDRFEQAAERAAEAVVMRTPAPVEETEETQVESVAPAVQRTAQTPLPVAQREISKASGEISIGAPGNVYTDDEQWEDSLNFLLLQTTLMPLDRAIAAAEAKPPRFDQVRSESQDALVGLTSYREIAAEDADTSAAEDALLVAAEVVNGFTDDNAARTQVLDTIGLLDGLKIKEDPDKSDPSYMRRMATNDLNKVLEHLYLPLVLGDLGKLAPDTAAAHAMSAGIRVGMLQVEDESRGRLAEIATNVKIIEGSARAWASKGANLGKVLKEARQTVMSTAMAKPKPKPSSHSVTGFVQPTLQRSMAPSEGVSVQRVLPLIVAGVAGFVAGVAIGDRIVRQTRSLKQDEINYAKDVFGESLDYSAITVTRDSVAAVGASRTIGNTVNLQDALFVDDTMDLTDHGKQILIHEMAHVWQYQHEGWTYAPAALWAQAKSVANTGSLDQAYDWESLHNAGVPWTEWNPEAQAEAVEDYNKALRKAREFQAQLEDYEKLLTLQPYIDVMQAGPPPAPENTTENETDSYDGGGGAEGSGPGYPPVQPVVQRFAPPPPPGAVQEPRVLVAGSMTPFKEPEHARKELERVFIEGGQAGLTRYVNNMLFTIKDYPEEDKTQIKNNLESGRDGLLLYGERYLTTFENGAKATVEGMLQASDAVIKSEMQRYGLDENALASGEARLADNADTKGMVEAVKVLQEEHAKLQKAHEKALGGMNDLTDIQQMTMTQDQIDQALLSSPEYVEAAQNYEIMFQGYAGKYPLIAAYKDNPLAMAKLTEAGSSPETAMMIAQTIKEKQENITETRENLASGELKIWTLKNVIEATKPTLQVAPKSKEARFIDDYAAKVESQEKVANIAMAALSISVGILAAAATMGGSLALGAALTGAGAALSAKDLMDTVNNYQVTKAAAGTSLNKAQAVAQQDPSLFWVAVALVGAGLDVVDAILVFRKLIAPIHRYLSLRRSLQTGNEGAELSAEAVEQLNRQLADEVDPALQGAPEAAQSQIKNNLDPSHALPSVTRSAARHGIRWTDQEVYRLAGATEQGRRALEIQARYRVGIAASAGDSSYFHAGGSTVYISRNLSPQEAASTFVHEMTHAEWHFRKFTANTADWYKMPRGEYIKRMCREEAEAESNAVRFKFEQQARARQPFQATSPVEQTYSNAFAAEARRLRSENPDIEESMLWFRADNVARNAVYQDFLRGRITNSVSGEPYPVYYGKQWDNANPLPSYPLE